jgi:septal ring factor EnvC (AmiA/AmiB activator)
MDTTALIEAYGELSALGLLAVLLSVMINSLLKENRSQTEHIDEIQQDLAKIQSEMTNTMNICVKLIDSINAFKNSFNDKMDRRHERLNESLDELEKSVHYMQGRLNGNK